MLVFGQVDRGLFFPILIINIIFSIYTAINKYLFYRAVRGAVNLSQLYLSLHQLESCIAWEKSVMRVLCQVCRSDDNEDQLLLCDSCDKGYHTYCFKVCLLSDYLLICVSHRYIILYAMA